MELKKLQKVLLFSFLVSQSLSAGFVFSVDLKNDTTGESFHEETSDILELIDTFDKDFISSKIDNYVDTHQISADLDFRGLPMQLLFAENSAVLNLNIASLGINETFNGADREASLTQLRHIKFLKHLF